MNEDNIRTSIIEVLNKFVEPVDTATIDPNLTFHEQFEFDSIDFINFASLVGSTLQVEIPEEDYYRLATLNGCVDYLASRMTAAAETRPS